MGSIDVSLAHSSSKPKEEEKWQIELTLASDTKVYLCVETESEMNNLIRGLQGWIGYFLTESHSSAKGDGTSGSREFSVSNSERKNAANLKAYYAALRRNDSGASGKGTSAPLPGSSPSSAKLTDGSVTNGGSEAKAQTVDTDSPARGGMYRTASGRDLGATSANTTQSNGAMVSRGSHPDLSLASSPSSSSGSPRHLSATSSPPSGLMPQERSDLQRQEIESLTLRLKEAHEGETALRRDLDAARQALADKDLEMRKQLEELNATFEGKKRSLNFIVNAKDMEIEKLRIEKQKVIDARVKELEDSISLRDLEITELKSKLNDKEIEILERKESEMALQEKLESTVNGVTKESAKKLQELQEMHARLKDRYFLALALASPALAAANQASLDLHALYDRCLREQIPFDAWPEWLTQFANENQRAEGEEENVENF